MGSDDIEQPLIDTASPLVNDKVHTNGGNVQHNLSSKNHHFRNKSKNDVHFADSVKNYVTSPLVDKYVHTSGVYIPKNTSLSTRKSPLENNNVHTNIENVSKNNFATRLSSVSQVVNISGIDFLKKLISPSDTPTIDTTAPTTILKCKNYPYSFYPFLCLMYKEVDNFVCLDCTCWDSWLQI